MADPLTGYAGAVDRIQAIADWKPVATHLRARAMSAPGKSRKAMAWAVAWWFRQALPHLPVRARAGAASYRRHGGGMLKKMTRPRVTASRDEIAGGLYAGVHYAIWLAAGTRHIAKGRVLKWKPGRATIKTWPAKRAGGNPRGELPIVLPWQHAARDKLVEILKKEV